MALAVDETVIAVDLDDGASDGDARDVAQRHGITLRPNSPMVGVDRVYLATVPSGDATRVLRALSADPEVDAAEENREVRALFVPNDPMYDQQWGMQRVGLPRSSEVTCGRGATVAVIDTGVACENHGEFTRIPDLDGARCLPGWNFVNDTAHANDDQGHGTHVAGTIAQTTNNQLGTAGVAFCATILPVKVLDARGSGSLADVAEGIRWAADHGADVINLSLGGDGRSKLMDQAVEYAHRRGVTVVCAAGNSGRAVGSPANAPHAIAVSAIDSGDQIAFFSSRGPEIAIAAPGVAILQQTICERGRNRCEQFASWSGTSMAAPHVAGAAALMYSLGVTDPDRVRSLLLTHSTPAAHGGAEPELYGAGIVSASVASDAVLQTTGVTRALMLLGLALGLALWIRNKKGELTAGWLLPAVITGVGLFFLPSFVGHYVPGVDLAMRPAASWDVLLFGAHLHRWLPFANLGVVLALVGLGFSRPSLRSPIGGVALGTASYLLSELFLRTGFAPLGSMLYLGWIALNVTVCLWVARIGIDRKTR
ncbi:MAG: S8 family peptidase [Deltaproteobacteria bacterium]|nr:S8 family peptidase [Myxococcales bacterium]MDP3217441.1 S8 family peptidase [Deltaproteobacteria bacterium]